MLNKWQRDFIEHYNSKFASLSDDDLVCAVLKVNNVKSITDDLVDSYCTKWAYKDSFLQAGRFVGFNNKQQKAIEVEFKKLYKTYNFVFDRQMIYDLGVFIDSNYSLSITREISKGKRAGIKQTSSCSSLGLAQKYVNMFFKNISMYDNYYSKTIGFNECDCPLDSNILRSIGKNSVSWGKINKSDYEDCQSVIASILNKNSTFSSDPFLKQHNNMSYDFLFFLDLLLP